MSTNVMPVASRDLPLTLLAAIAMAAALIAKFMSIGRANINWDEFWYLTGVHRLIRGDLDTVFHSAYAWAFMWLPSVGDEIDQILAARACMTVLFSITALLVWRLAARWTSPIAGTIAAIAYLSVSYVGIHGGSFRADAMIAPLSMGVLALLAGQSLRPGRLAVAGVLFGLSFIVSTKAVLVLPIAACLLLIRQAEPLETRLQHVVIFGVVSGAVAAVTLGIHGALVTQADPLTRASSRPNYFRKPSTW